MPERRIVLHLAQAALARSRVDLDTREYLMLQDGFLEREILRLLR